MKMTYKPVITKIAYGYVGHIIAYVDRVYFDKYMRDNHVFKFKEQAAAYIQKEIKKYEAVDKLTM